MLEKYFNKEAHKLDEPVDAVLHEMQLYGPNSPEYAELLSHLERLVRIRKEDKRMPISSDTMAIVSGNLLGILIVVMYEQKHVMTSKAHAFLLKKNP